MKLIFAIATGIALCACGGDSFKIFVIEGGSDIDAVQDSSNDSETGMESVDSSIVDSMGDTLATPDASDSGCMQSGTAACTSVIDAYCTRLAACCNQGCAYSWANQGGMACRQYWEANVSQMDCPKYGQKQVCSEGACLVDTQQVSCSTIICNNQMPCPPFPKPMLISNACTSFWGSL